MNLLSTIKKLKLFYLELILLCLMIVSLPSLEAPKNIFLILFLVVAIFRQYKQPNLRVWGLWDWMFLTIVISAFLSTLFAGLSPGDSGRALGRY